MEERKIDNKKNINQDSCVSKDRKDSTSELTTILSKGANSEKDINENTDDKEIEFYNDKDNLKKSIGLAAPRSIRVPVSEGYTPSGSSMVEDPKEYQLAPFELAKDDTENVSLNSGSLELSFTDFILPGKNGFDLAVTRYYSSSMSNQNEHMPKWERKARYYWIIKFKCRFRNIYTKMTWTEEIELIDPIGNYGTSEDAEYAAYLAWDNDIDHGYYEGNLIDKENEIISISRMKPITKYKVADIQVSDSRPNDHMLNTYGLGLGWGFGFPSIEVVKEQYRVGRKNVKFYNFLHLGDGRVYKLETDRLKDYKLKDITFFTRRDTINGRDYHYVLTYKDGKRAYFYKESESCIKLTAMTDRFGNMIAFNLNEYGGTIVDTVGRTITLNRIQKENGYLLTWTLPDGTSIVYTVENGLLKNVSNQAGQKTTYDYTSGEITKSFADYQFGDEGIKVYYQPISSITYHSGAESKYTYGYYNEKHGDFAATQSIMWLTKAADYEKNGEEKNLREYSYTTSWKKMDRGGFNLYIQSTVVTEGEKTDHYFFGYQKPVSRHSTKIRGEIVRDRVVYEFYKDILPVKETVSQHQDGKIITTETSMSYDEKGNLLSVTVPIKGTTLISYDSLYNLIEQKVYYRDVDVKIREVYELRSDKKVVVWKKVYETKNGIERLVEATEYEYDGENNVSRKRRYADISLSKSDDDLVTEFDYKSTNLTANYNGLYLTKKWISNIKDTNGSFISNIVESYSYDVMGRVLEKKDPDDKVFNYEFDSLGRIRKEYFPKSNPQDQGEKRFFKEIQYLDSQNQIIEIDEEGHSKRFEYTSLGKIERVYAINPDTLLFYYKYDNKQRIKYSYEYNLEGTISTHYEYDDLDRVKSKTISGSNIDSYEEKYFYDDTYDTTRQYSKESKEIVGTDVNSPSINSYILKDVLGRVKEETIGNSTIKTEYDYMDNKKSKTDPRNEMISVLLSYDYANRIVSETRQTESGNFTCITEYNALGYKRWVKDFRNKYTYFNFDAAGRLLEQKMDFNESEKMVTRYSYNPVGNIINQKILSSNGKYNEINYTYDSRHRLLDTILHDGKIETRSRFSYDGCGNKTALYIGMLGSSTEGAEKTTYTYDRFKNVKSITDSIGNSKNPTEIEKRTEYYNYDSYGRLQSKIDRNGFITSYTYDGLGRIMRESVNDPSGSQHSNNKGYSYYKNGNKKSEENDNVKIIFAYNNMGKLISQIEDCKQGAANTVVKSYAYDQCGNRTSFNVTKDGINQISLSYKYDMQNRLKDVFKNNLHIASYEYDENSNRKFLTYPQNGVRTEYDYNDANLVMNLYNKKNGVHRSSYHYRYSPDGNQTQKITKIYGKVDRVTDYIYDKLGRLIEEKESGGNRVNYEYDRFQNRSKMTVTDINHKITTTDYQYDIRNRLQVETKQHEKTTEITTYRYDYNGNQVYREWERFSPKTEKKTPGHVGFTSNKFSEDVVILETREYNGLNELIYLYRDGYETRYFYRPDGLRHKKVFNDNTTATHIWDGQNIVAEYNQNGYVTARYLRGINLIAREQDNLLQYYLFNAHGDVIERTDPNGNTLKNYDYDAFGVEKNEEMLDQNPFRYCGEYYDKESQTIYLRARSYDPRTGRFTSQDPIRDGINWYTYCGGNPVKYVDPLGLAICLKGTKEEKNNMLENLKKLTDDDLVLNKSGNIEIKNRKKGEKVKGTKLLRETIDPEETIITIQYNHFKEKELKEHGWDSWLKGKNFIVPDSYKDSRIQKDGKPGKGSSSNIYFAPNETIFKKFPQIALGHELIHAHHNMIGTRIYSDSEDEKNEGWTTYNGEGGTYKAPYEELYTVGVLKNKNYPSIVTENDLRAEQKIYLRFVYRYDWK